MSNIQIGIIHRWAIGQKHIGQSHGLSTLPELHLINLYRPCLRSNSPKPFFLGVMWENTNRALVIKR